MSELEQVVGLKQKALAEQLKLSPATVSKSLRNHPAINPETRARVLELAARLGYRVPANARTGRASGDGETKFVGVLVTGRIEPGDVSGASFLTGLSEQAGARRLSLIVHHLPEGHSHDLLDPALQPQAMRDGSLRGLVLIHHFEHDVVRRLADRWPVVTLVRQVMNARLDHVDVDHSLGLGLLVEHLFGLGHRRIGFIGRGPQISYSLARFGSYAQALARHGLAIDPARLVNVTEPTQGFDDIAEQVVRGTKQGTTAWACASDWIANELYARLVARGLRVPADVSITGFDGLESMPGIPRLTSVKAPFIDMGSAALSRLMERIDTPTLPSRQMLLACDLVKGETSGPVNFERGR